MVDNFDEKSGLVTSKTSWGKWGQTIEDINIFIDVPEGTTAKFIRCKINPKNISFVVKENILFQGDLYGKVVVDDCLWTLEDRKQVRLTLVKVNKDASNCWKSLLVNDYVADAWTFNEMEKKLTLERFQKENPGFDFSKADLSGNYHGGGPILPGQ